MKKQLEIAAKLNTEEFDKSIGDMQKKLKDMYAPSNAMLASMQQNQRLDKAGLGNGASQTPAAQAAYKNQVSQVRRELDQSLQTEVKAQAALVKSMVERDNLYKKLLADSKDVTKSEKEQLEIAEKLAKVKANNAREMSAYQQKDQQIKDLFEQREKMKPKGWARIAEGMQNGGGLRGGLNEAKGMWNETSAGGRAGLFTGGMAALGSGVLAAGSAYRYFGEQPIRTASAMGNAIGGTYGKEIGNAYAGRSAMDMAFIPEKAKAAQMAGESMKRRKETMNTDMLGDVMLEGFGGAGLGMMTGPAAPIMAPALGLAGVGHALWKHKEAAFAPFSKTMRNARDAKLAEGFSQDYGSAVEGLKAQNPLKTMAAEDYNSNFMGRLDFQRSMGMSQSQLDGHNMGQEHMPGYRESAINAGFRDTEAMGMAGSVLGAGGSTRMAKDEDFTGLKAARNFDVTNAGSVLGKISGTMGDSESSKKAFIEMIAEGNRRGLDSSNFAEENRKFLDAAASAVSGSGSRDAGSASDLTKRFGGFLADQTTAGVGAATSAYQMANDNKSQTAGPRGVARFTAMRKDAMLGQLGGLDQAKLMAIGDDQVSVDNPAVRGIFRRNKKEGQTIEDFVSHIQKANENGNNLTGDSDKLAAKGRSLNEAIAKEKDPAKKKKLQEQLGEVTDDLAGNANLEQNGLGKDQVKGRAFVSGQVGGTNYSNMTSAEAKAEMEKKNTGRDGDTTNQANAEASRIVLQNFVAMKDQLIVTSEQMAIFNQRLQATVEAAMKMPEDKRGTILKPFEHFLGNQNQAGGKNK